MCRHGTQQHIYLDKPLGLRCCELSALVTCFSMLIHFLSDVVKNITGLELGRAERAFFHAVLELSLRVHPKWLPWVDMVKQLINIDRFHLINQYSWTLSCSVYPADLNQSLFHNMHYSDSDSMQESQPYLDKCIIILLLIFSGRVSFIDATCLRLLQH